MLNYFIFYLNHSEIVFKKKDMEMEWTFFESFYPDVQVAANILDIWSLVLNHEERYRDKISRGANVYCHSVMLVSDLNTLYK